MKSLCILNVYNIVHNIHNMTGKTFLNGRECFGEVAITSNDQCVILQYYT